jgi:F0F1-type ATP synthase delta subunit
VLEESLIAREGEVVSFDYRQAEESLTIVATVRSFRPADQGSVDAIAAELEDRLERRVTLEVVILPVIRSGGE